MVNWFIKSFWTIVFFFIFLIANKQLLFLCNARKTCPNLPSPKNFIFWKSSIFALRLFFLSAARREDMDSLVGELAWSSFNKFDDEKDPLNLWPCFISEKFLAHFGVNANFWWEKFWSLVLSALVMLACLSYIGFFLSEARMLGTNCLIEISYFFSGLRLLFSDCLWLYGFQPLGVISLGSVVVLTFS